MDVAPVPGLHRLARLRRGTCEGVPREAILPHNTGGGPPAWQRYAEAFHEALPYEPTFWLVHFGESKTDYDNIRAWVRDYVGIEPSGDK